MNARLRLSLMAAVVFFVILPLSLIEQKAGSTAPWIVAPLPPLETSTNPATVLSAAIIVLAMLAAAGIRWEEHSGKDQIL